MSMNVRPARRKDALHVAALIDIAGHGIEAEFWSANVGSDGSLVSAARRLILDDEAVPYHLSKAYLLRAGGEVAAGLIGGVVSAGGGISPGFPGCFAPLLELEAHAEGYWGIIGIAVYPEFRGQGIAKHLLGHAALRARRAKSAGLSLVVEDTNLPAINLYRSLGFEERERRPWLAYGNRSGPNHWLLFTNTF